ncbi:unnamed protein product, partial [Allacma fusca]
CLPFSEKRKTLIKLAVGRKSKWREEFCASC